MQTEKWTWQHPRVKSPDDYAPMEGNLVFEHVVFGYDKKNVIGRGIHEELVENHSNYY